MEEPIDVEPEVGEGSAPEDAVLERGGAVDAVLGAEVELGLFAVGVEEPIFGDGGLFVLVELFAAVASAGVGADDLDNEVGWAFEVGFFEAGEVGGGDEEDIGGAAGEVGGGFHLEGLVSELSQMVMLDKVS